MVGRGPNIVSTPSLAFRGVTWRSQNLAWAIASYQGRRYQSGKNFSVRQGSRHPLYRHRHLPRYRQSEIQAISKPPATNCGDLKSFALSSQLQQDSFPAANGRRPTNAIPPQVGLVDMLSLRIQAYSHLVAPKLSALADDVLAGNFDIAETTLDCPLIQR
jgi:hypothetical protein